MSPVCVSTNVSIRTVNSSTEQTDAASAVSNTKADKEIRAVVVESDGLSEDGHVNKQEAYKDKCVIEALILLIGVACCLMPLFDCVSRNYYHLVSIKQTQLSVCITL